MSRYLSRALRAAAVALTFAVNVTYAQVTPSTEFDRFSSETPPLLEADSLTVLTTGMMNELAAKICMRVSPAVASEVDEWTRRNASYTRAASVAVNEIAARIETFRGEVAKQSYWSQLLRMTAGKASSTIVRKLGGASVDNDKVPPTAACSDIVEYLRSGGADFTRTPQYITALSKFIELRGIR
jgi:hypothetical protein